MRVAGQEARPPMVQPAAGRPEATGPLAPTAGGRPPLLQEAPLLRWCLWWVAGVALAAQLPWPAWWWAAGTLATAVAGALGQYWLERPGANRLPELGGLAPEPGVLRPWREGRWLAALAALSLLLAGAARAAEQRDQLAEQRAHWQDGTLLRGPVQVMGLPVARGGQWRVPVAPGGGPPVLLVVPATPGADPPRPGDWLAVTATLRLPAPAANPGQWDYQAYLARQGLSAVAYALGPAEPGAPHPAPDQGLSVRGLWRQVRLGWLRAAQGLQRAWQQSLAGGLPQPERSTLSALVLGDRGNLDPATEQAFRQAGLAHILSVSGWHAGLVSLAWWRLWQSAFGAAARLLGRARVRVSRRLQRYLVAVTTVAGLWWYVTATGAPPAAVRAGWMATAGCLATAAGLTRRPLNALGLAVLILLAVNPALLADAGFQLSCAATLALLVLVPAMLRREVPTPEETPGQAPLAEDAAAVGGAQPAPRGLGARLASACRATANRLTRWLGAGLAVSLAAQAGTLPLQAVHFGVINPVGPLATMVATPLAAAAMASGLLGVWVAWVWPGHPVWAFEPALLSLRLLLRWADWCASLPWAAWELSAPGPAACGLFWAAVAGWYWVWTRGRPGQAKAGGWPPRLSAGPTGWTDRVTAWSARWAPALVPALLLALGWAWQPAWRAVSGRLEVWFLAVGEGDAILVRTPRGRMVLIDGGGRVLLPGGYDAGERIVLPFLRHQGVRRLDAVVATHPHADHVGGLVAVVRGRRVGQVWIGLWPREAGAAAQALLAAAREERVPVYQMGVGVTWELEPGLTLSVLGPSPGFSAGGARNDASLVLSLRYRRVRFLLPGDLEVEGQRALLRQDMPLRAEVLKVPHHGRLSAYWPPFLAQVAPRVAVVSTAGAGPAAPLREALEAAGVWVWGTDWAGAIRVRTDGWHLWVDGYRCRRSCGSAGAGIGPPPGEARNAKASVVVEGVSRLARAGQPASGFVARGSGRERG